MERFYFMSVLFALLAWNIGITSSGKIILYINTWLTFANYYLYHIGYSVLQL